MKLVLAMSRGAQLFGQGRRRLLFLYSCLQFKSLIQVDQHLLVLILYFWQHSVLCIVLEYDLPLHLCFLDKSLRSSFKTFLLVVSVHVGHQILVFRILQKVKLV